MTYRHIIKKLAHVAFGGMANTRPKKLLLEIVAICFGAVIVAENLLGSRWLAIAFGTVMIVALGVWRVLCRHDQPPAFAFWDKKWWQKED